MNTVRISMTFDQLQRYCLAGEMADAVRDRKVFRVLDAGSREGFLRRYLPEDRIVNLDRGIFSGDGFLRGDALCLPFPDQAFDVAVSIDVLEHLSPPDRSGLLAEMARVSRRAFIIGAPCQSDEVTQAEELVAAFSLRIRGRENEFLREHRREGLPRLQEVLKWGATRGYRTAVVPNGYLPRWLMMISLNEYLGRLPDPWDMIFAANRLYHEQFYRADNAAPAYRQMILFGKDGVFNPAEIEQKLAGASLPGTGTAAAFTFLKKLFDSIEGEKDTLIRKISAEKEKQEEETAAQIRELVAIIDEKAAALAAIQQSRAYQIFRKVVRLFDPSQP